MAKIRAIWHQWSWLFHLSVWLVGGTAAVITYKDAISNNTADIAEIQAQKLPERMATQEQATKDIHGQLDRMERVQGKIFDRINTIVDQRHR